MFRAQTFLDSVGTVLSLCVLRRAVLGKESRCVSTQHPYPYSAVRAHSVVLWLQKTMVTEDIHPFTGMAAATCKLNLLRWQGVKRTVLLSR